MADGIDVIVVDLRNFTRGEVIALGVNVNANLRDAPPLGTPIDTGWASANWVPSVGTPASSAAAREVAGEPTPAQVASARAAAEQGINEILGWNFNNGSIFSTNNVPYISALNEGWSNQSPSGFVPIAIERAVRDTGATATRRANRSRRIATTRAGRPG